MATYMQTCRGSSSALVFAAFVLLSVNSFAFRPAHRQYFALRKAKYDRCVKLGLSDDGSSPRTATASGLYRKFASHAWTKLHDSGFFQEVDIPAELKGNEAPAKGTKDSVVRISTKAMVPSASSEGLVRYARVALLETVSPSSASSTQREGIQVLNFVVIPADSTSLPVLGIDLVSLPGGKHLLLLDSQPMTHPNPYEYLWQQWHLGFVKDNPKFPWGGDFPEPVQAYVSKNALWTTLQEQEDPVRIIENEVYEAFVAHMDIYLNLLQRCSRDLDTIQGKNHQEAYLQYRRSNDPAKPMLNSLFGTEWTDRILDEILFPQE